jgi:hypothetical protein
MRLKRPGSDGQAMLEYVLLTAAVVGVGVGAQAVPEVFPGLQDQSWIRGLQNYVSDVLAVVAGPIP